MSEAALAKPSRVARRAGPLARFRRILPDRSRLGWMLPAAGIAIGLAVAGAGLFRPAPRPISAVPPGYVALVNQKGILTSDFITQTQTEAETSFAQATPAQRRHVLHEMIDQELLVQRALVLDLPETTTEVRDAMAAAVNAQVAAPLLEIEPTDAELRTFYDQHRAKYTIGGTMIVHDLLLHYGTYADADQSLPQAESDAAEAVYQLRSGASLDYVKEHFGFVDSGRVSDGEELEFAAKIHLGATLYPVAAALNAGEVSDPVVIKDGVHVLVMEQRQLPRPAPFSAVRDQVYSDFRAVQKQRATDENLGILRAQTQIRLAPGESE
ncbi:MAG: peptidyl-prolyl cis-trans isomerase [Steroidobacteraceae bacterium]